MRTRLIPSRKLQEIRSWFSILALAGIAFGLALPQFPPERQQKPHARNALQYTASLMNLPLSFESNVGQAPSETKFLAHGPGYSISLTATEMALTFRVGQGLTGRGQSATALGLQPAASSRQPVILRMKLVGANLNARGLGVEELSGKSNYFIGKDRSRWRTGLPTYARVKFADVYPGIDLVYYGNNGRLEYDFIVAPGSDPKDIELAFDGVDKVAVDAQGDLVFPSSDQKVQLRKPHVYQEENNSRREIAASYVPRSGNLVGFHIVDYDDRKPIVIDPALVYSTYLGGTSSDIAYAIAVDPSGNAYVTGWTFSSDFPVVSAAQPHGGPTDAFVTKLNATGGALVYSTYLGGGGDDIGYGIAVDSSGKAYVTGWTNSGNFPVTQGAFQGTCAADGFITKLNTSGSALEYSACFGGDSTDQGSAITVDSAGSVYVTGVTSSGNFPTTPGAFDRACGSDGNCNRTSSGPVFDAFVLKMNPTGTSLVYSTFLGGNGEDRGTGISVDSSGNAVVTGRTQSSDFPTTLGALLASATGGGFVAKLNPTGTALLYSTYLDASGSAGVVLDVGGNFYVTGTTGSPNFPTTPGAFQIVMGGGTDAFVIKFNPVGALVYSTYLGGSNYDGGTGIALDPAGNAYILGFTSSDDFPTLNPMQGKQNRGGDSDMFVTKLNVSGSALVYSTYFGAIGQQYGYGIAVDPAGNAYLTGATYSANFPLANPLKASATGGEAFVTKLNSLALAITSLSPSTANTEGPGFSLAIKGLGFVPGSIVRWNASDRPTTFNSDRELSAAISSRDVAVAGTAQVTVFNPGLDGGTSGPFTFSISNPLPILGSLFPSSLVAGGGGFTLTLQGSGFFSKSVVLWNRAQRPTTFISNTTLQASIPTTDILTGGSASVAVSNPFPGGGTSNSLTFVIIGNPAPFISSLTPSKVTAGSPSFTLNVVGSGFLPNSVVRWNGGDRPTGFVSNSQLQAAIPAADIATPGTGRVTVFNPPPGGGNSFTATLTIEAPSGRLLIQVGDLAGVFFSGAAVSADGAATQVTGARGEANFTLSPGVYNVQVSAPSFQTARFTASVVAGQVTSTALTLVPTGTGTTTTVTVPATAEQNFDTGVNLRAGQTLVLTAAGTWGFSSAATDFPLSPDGRLGCRGGVGWTLPNGGYCGALAARVGTGDWFYVGPAFAGPARTSGRLFLSINDQAGGFADNRGSLAVTITVVDTNICPIAEPNLSITLQPGFYIGEVRLAPGTREGYWGMEVLAQQGLLAGGFNLGGGVHEAGHTAGFGGFFVPSTQTVRVRLEAQVLPGADTSRFSTITRLLDRNRQQIGTEQLGTSFVQFDRALSQGFYILEVITAPNAPRATFQLALNADAFSGGVDVGGFLMPGLVGFGAFYVPEPQEVRIRVLGLGTYLNVGASCLRLTLLDANRNVIRSVP